MLRESFGAGTHRAGHSAAGRRRVGLVICSPHVDGAPVWRRRRRFPDCQAALHPHTPDCSSTAPVVMRFTPVASARREPPPDQVEGGNQHQQAGLRRHLQMGSARSKPDSAVSRPGPARARRRSSKRPTSAASSRPFIPAPHAQVGDHDHFDNRPVVSPGDLHPDRADGNIIQALDETPLIGLYRSAQSVPQGAVVIVRRLKGCLRLRTARRIFRPRDEAVECTLHGAKSALDLVAWRMWTWSVLTIWSI
jgi:hypothetical protein